MKLINNNKFNMIILFGLMILCWLAITFAIGPPDEAPPFFTPGP